MSTSMPTHLHGPIPGAPLTSRMVARSPHEAHRASTPLELFFDLVFVVAIAESATALHHAVAEAHAAQGLVGFLMVFFAIWWAWMNFTWFASAYDVDDLRYRVAVFVQMFGALVIAAGIPEMFSTFAPNTTVISGYLIMRIAGVAQWLRAAADDPERRATALRYAAGISVLQVAWIAMIWFPHLWGRAFVVLLALEIAVPVWAERAAPTTWHPHHIAERYGLLTLIVLGESILSATLAVQSALKEGTALRDLLPVIIGGWLTACSMWWLYFDRPVHDLLTSFRKALMWGYGHYFVFASAAAVGAGLAVNVDQATHHAKISATVAGAAVAIPVATFLICLWVLHDRPEYRPTRWMGPAAAALVLLTPFSGRAVLLTGIVLAAMIAIKLLHTRRARL